MFFVFASFGLLLGGSIILVAATVGVCAAAVAVLYGAAHLFADLFGFSRSTTAAGRLGSSYGPWSLGR